MSPDELFIVQLAQALNAVGLEAIIVGNAAAALQGAPVPIQAADLLLRDTPRNHEKLARLCGVLGVGRPIKVSELANVLTIVGTRVPIDLIFDCLSGNLSFESVRSRSTKVALKDQIATVASLEDVIKSKEAAGRPKDRAVLPILQDTLRVKKALE
jgi:hypothetical protein